VTQMARRIFFVFPPEAGKQKNQIFPYKRLSKQDRQIVVDKINKSRTVCFAYLIPAILLPEFRFF
jgi:hypothetical protein